MDQRVAYESEKNLGFSRAEILICKRSVRQAERALTLHLFCLKTRENSNIRKNFDLGGRSHFSSFIFHQRFKSDWF